MSVGHSEHGSYIIEYYDQPVRIEMSHKCGSGMGSLSASRMSGPRSFWTPDGLLTVCIALRWFPTWPSSYMVSMEGVKPAFDALNSGI